MCNSLNFLLAPSQCTGSIALCYISFNHISILSYLFIFHMHVCICKYVLPLIPYTFSPFTLLYYYYYCYYYYYYRFSSIPFHSTPPPRLDTHTHTHTYTKPQKPVHQPNSSSFWSRVLQTSGGSYPSPTESTGEACILRFVNTPPIPFLLVRGS
ncbi:hypothetical protein, conserved [Trypanosoma brucei gambiense DAL972]|uniref:Uncharacterized protein n=1 Tax=Trypanosoma brucei gambiense (strain MHOM/CI/86/DAL972) TaxID=679716 RepID=C9ZMC7_TRYB9|nr:hypothetical protein, conserved [Trypanosoma brucei gambiense DAL972]CBH10800.1 hypothetical protein, conserved [Trypanosoma brucei gambiense DAL972]|eukprot:XP_011773088.1 hypothetical protein, conserved [Trypanosoma brucei gambiense DAL972]